MLESKNAVQSDLHKRATFCKAEIAYYTQVTFFSRVSQKICRVENLLLGKFIRKLLSKEDLAVCLIFLCFIAQKNTCIYNASWAFQWFHRIVYTSLDYFVNLMFNWPINTLFIGNLTFGKYEVAVL